MSHEIEHRADGQDSFFEIGRIKSAWHNLGELWAQRPKTIEEMFERAPWLNYPVVKSPTTITMTAPDGSTYEKQSAKAFVTLRTDTNEELGAVGPDYSPVQNIDAFRATIGPMVEAGVIQVETGGVLRDGADAWVLGSFDVAQFGPVVQEVFPGEIVPYALVAVNHSGRRKNRIQLTPIRVVCANTLGAAESASEIDVARSIEVAHRGDAEAKMVEAAEQLFGGIIEKYEVIAKQYRLLKHTFVTNDAFRALVIVPTIGIHPTQRDSFNPEAKLAERTIERYERRRDTITDLWRSGAGHTGDDSAWEAYNGVVEAIDHNEDLFPARSGVYRLGSLLDGELREKKQRALVNLVDYATAPADALDYWKDSDLTYAK